MWITDPDTGKKSVTVTLFVIGYVTCLLKLLTSGMSFGTLSLGAFTASDFAIIVSSLGAIYWGRKHTDANSTKLNDKE